MLFRNAQGPRRPPNIFCICTGELCVHQVHLFTKLGTCPLTRCRGFPTPYPWGISRGPGYFPIPQTGASSLLASAGRHFADSEVFGGPSFVQPDGIVRPSNRCQSTQGTRCTDRHASTHPSLMDSFATGRGGEVPVKLGVTEVTGVTIKIKYMILKEFIEVTLYWDLSMGSVTCKCWCNVIMECTRVGGFEVSTHKRSARVCVRLWMPPE